jgi:hypothetical protein
MLGPGKSYYPEYVFTDESWLNGAGTGREIFTVDSVVGFANNTRDVWIEAGSPAIFPQRQQVTTGNGIPLENLSDLPTDAAALAQEIAQHKTGLASVNADIENAADPEGTFMAATIILSEESVGGTPTLRSALFKVMADLPGIKLMGQTATRSGQRGVGLETPPDQSGNVFRVIIDPAGGQVLETDEYNRGSVEGWTDFLGTGVARNIGDVPGA